MFKLGKLTDYGTVLMTALAIEPARVHSAHELAESTHVSAPTVSKLLKVLAKGGLVEASRGAHGGYRLARAAEQITIADIVRALEGPIAVTQCSEHSGLCSIESSCTTSANWRLINTAIQEALSSVTLAQMTIPMRRAPVEVHPLTFHRGARSEAPG
jgi:FeS assembly SUF system regulator